MTLSVHYTRSSFMLHGAPAVRVMHLPVAQAIFNHYVSCEKMRFPVLYAIWPSLANNTTTHTALPRLPRGITYANSRSEHKRIKF